MIGDHGPDKLVRMMSAKPSEIRIQDASILQPPEEQLKVGKASKKIISLTDDMSCGEDGEVDLGPKNFIMKGGDKLKAHGPTKDIKLLELNLSKVPVKEEMG